MTNSSKISNGVEKIKFDWENIFEMGKRIGIPKTKKRAIIREYLQCHFLKFIYSQKNSQRNRAFSF